MYGSEEVSKERSAPLVVLITKTRTQNQGNQALSTVWRDFLAEQFPAGSVRLLERAPSYLKRYTIGRVASSKNPVAEFESICQGLLARCPAEPMSDPSVWTVEHDPSQQQVLRFLKIRQGLRLRSRMASFGVGEDDYLDRVAYMARADLVVVNPAGEFLPNATDTALHYLIEMRCAQLAGARTAMVNLSLEVEDPHVLQLSRHVFDKCDVVEFRDEQSREALIRLGSEREPLVCPDGAIMSNLKRSEAGPRKEGILLAVNGQQVLKGKLLSHWDRLIGDFQDLGPVTFTSNEWSTDSPVWQPFLDRPGVMSAGETLDFEAYAAMLAEYPVVVSSRLHTCVLGLVAGAAVVPVETGTFKLSGFYDQLGMGGEPIRMGSENWESRLMERVLRVMNSPAARVAEQDESVETGRATWRKVMGEAFSPGLVQTDRKW